MTQCRIDMKRMNRCMKMSGEDRRSCVYDVLADYWKCELRPPDPKDTGALSAAEKEALRELASEDEETFLAAAEAAKSTVIDDLSRLLDRTVDRFLLSVYRTEGAQTEAGGADPPRKRKNSDRDHPHSRR